MPFSSGFPKVMSNSPPTDRIIPERPPSEIASAVNKFFIVLRHYTKAGNLPMGFMPTAA